MPPATVYPIRLTFVCEEGCTVRFLTTRLADLTLDKCPTCGGRLLDEFDAVTTKPCCAAAWNEDCRPSCLKARRAT